MTEKVIKIAGMSCQGCVAGVTGAIDRVGVEKRTVEIGSAVVVIDEEKTTLKGVVEAIEDAGYTVLSS